MLYHHLLMCPLSSLLPLRLVVPCLSQNAFQLPAESGCEFVDITQR